MVERPLPITEGTIPSSTLSWDEIEQANFRDEPKRLFREATHHAFEYPRSYNLFHGPYGNLEDMSRVTRKQLSDALSTGTISSDVSLRLSLLVVAYNSITRFATAIRIAPPDGETLLILQFPTERLATDAHELWAAVQRPKARARATALTLPRVLDEARENDCLLPVEPSEPCGYTPTYHQAREAAENGNHETVWAYSLHRMKSMTDGATARQTKAGRR